MLKHTKKRVIVKVDLNQKNGVTFEDGTEIELVRNVDNFDKKYTNQVMGTVVDAENIPKDALILFHHNSVDENYEIFNHSTLSGEDIKAGIKMYSVMERDCFFWKMSGEQEWHPTPGYATALRVFKPYTGTLEGIPPTLLKDTLYVTSGEYQGKVVKTLQSCDYQITFRDLDTGKDKSLIRFRPEGIPEEKREAEAIAIMDGLTDDVGNGKLLVGLDIPNCKTII